MFQRTFLVLLLALLPLGAMADTASDNAAASQLSQPGAAAANLGPSSGGSTTDGTNLQPAGTSPLQSTTSDSNGLTAPDSSMLQEPASSSSGNLQVLLGDNADGGQQPASITGIGSQSRSCWGLLPEVFPSMSGPGTEKRCWRLLVRRYRSFPPPIMNPAKYRPPRSQQTSGPPRPPRPKPSRKTHQRKSPLRLQRLRHRVLSRIKPSKINPHPPHRQYPASAFITQVIPAKSKKANAATTNSRLAGLARVK